MPPHKCNREDCPRENINGPKLQCTTCNNWCYLMCFGLKMDSLDADYKIILPKGATLSVELATCSFDCCSVKTSSTEPIPTKTNRTTPATQKANDDENHTIMSEINNIKHMLSDLKIMTDANNTNLLEITSTCIETNGLVKNVTEREFASEPTTSSMVDANNIALTTPSSRTILNANRTTAKRRLEQSKTPKPKPNPRFDAKNAPRAKTGTREINIGSPPETRPTVTVNKPVFEKSIHVSGLAKSVTVETMNEFILGNTNIKNQDYFKCHRLVKKDADISKWRYVCFKIDVTNEHYDHLIDPNTWPKYVAIREFVETQAVNLGNFVNSGSERAAKQQKMASKNQEASNGLNVQMEEN